MIWIRAHLCWQLFTSRAFLSWILVRPPRMPLTQDWLHSTWSGILISSKRSADSMLTRDITNTQFLMHAQDSSLQTTLGRKLSWGSKSKPAFTIGTICTYFWTALGKLGGNGGNSSQFLLSHNNTTTIHLCLGADGRLSGFVSEDESLLWIQEVEGDLKIIDSELDL